MLQVFPVLVFTCSILLQKISSFLPFSSIRIVLDCMFLSAHFLFRDILNLSLPFALNVTLNMSNVITKNFTNFDGLRAMACA